MRRPAPPRPAPRPAPQPASGPAPGPRTGHAIGIDVGGTKVAGGLVDLATGAVAARRQGPTRAHRGGEAVLAEVEALARALREEAQGLGLAPVGLGVGVPELVDPQGRVFSGHRVAWSGLPVQDRLAALIPARVESDVRAAALAEARFGAGRGIGDFLFVTIGTGVSAVLVQAGVPYAGSRGAALVIGNGPTRRRCPACGHEEARVLEDVASGPGLAAAFGVARAEAVLAAAAAGDALAQAVIAAAAAELGRALALLAGALDPAAIVLGGGLGSAPGPYHDALVAETQAGLWDADARPLLVLRAALGPNAGLVGAALAGAGALHAMAQPREHETT